MLLLLLHDFEQTTEANRCACSSPQSLSHVGISLAGLSLFSAIVVPIPPCKDDLPWGDWEPLGTGQGPDRGGCSRDTGEHVGAGGDQARERRPRLRPDRPSAWTRQPWASAPAFPDLQFLVWETECQCLPQHVGKRTVWRYAEVSLAPWTSVLSECQFSSGKVSSFTLTCACERKLSSKEGAAPASQLSAQPGLLPPSWCSHVSHLWPEGAIDT